MRKTNKVYASVSGIKKPNEVEKKSYVFYQDLVALENLDLFAEDSFAITLFEKAKGAHTINLKKYEVKNKQLHMQFMEQQQRWKLQPGVKGQRLIIRKALAETFSSKLQFTLSPYNQHPVLDLDASTYSKINAEFLAIKKELESKTVFIELVNARCRLVALMVSLWTEHEFGDRTQAESSSITYKFHALVEQHYKTQKSVAFYAKHLCITPNYLSILCKKQYEMSALEFIAQRVLLEAKRLLHSSDRSIKEIAFHLGFANLSYFSSFFKSKTNMTPKEYKEVLENS